MATIHVLSTLVLVNANGLRKFARTSEVESIEEFGFDNITIRFKSGKYWDVDGNASSGLLQQLLQAVMGDEIGQHAITGSNQEARTRLLNGDPGLLILEDVRWPTEPISKPL